MTTEDEFQAMLDAHRDDHATRLVLADWLQDQGDPRAEGYRALAAERSYPAVTTECAVWYQPETARESPARFCEDIWSLPPDWYETVREAGEPYRAPYGSPGTQFPTRREAEDAAALAFAKLPAERRAELLAAPQPA